MLREHKFANFSPQPAFLHRSRAKIASKTHPRLAVARSMDGVPEVPKYPPPSRSSTRLMLLEFFRFCSCSLPYSSGTSMHYYIIGTRLVYLPIGLCFDGIVELQGSVSGLHWTCSGPVLMLMDQIEICEACIGFVVRQCCRLPPLDIVSILSCYRGWTMMSSTLYPSFSNCSDRLLLLTGDGCVPVSMIYYVKSTSLLSTLITIPFVATQASELEDWSWNKAANSRGSPGSVHIYIQGEFKVHKSIVCVAARSSRCSQRVSRCSNHQPQRR